MNLYYSNLICQGLSLTLIIVPNAKLYYIQNYILNNNQLGEFLVAIL